MKTRRWNFNWKRWGAFLGYGGLISGALLLVSWLAWPFISEKLVQSRIRIRVAALTYPLETYSPIYAVAGDRDPPKSVLEGTWKLATSDKEKPVVREASAMEFWYWVQWGLPETKAYSSEAWEKAFVKFLDQKRKQTSDPRAVSLMYWIGQALAEKQAELKENADLESLYRTSAPAVNSEEAYLELKARLKEIEDHAPEENIKDLLGTPSFRFERHGGHQVYYVYLRPKPYSSLAGLLPDEAGFQVHIVDGSSLGMRLIRPSEVTP